MTRNRGRSRRSKIVVVLGESSNDRQAIRELLMALRDDCPPVVCRHTPLVLLKGRERAEQRKQAQRIADAIAGERTEVCLVVTHEDADDLEPAHEPIAEELEELLAGEGMIAVAAIPAFEMETWWYLWPDAVLATYSGWTHPNRRGRDLGRIRNAKEQLRRDLRGDRARRDYEESDSVQIAQKVRELGLIDTRHAKSASFERFAGRFRSIEF